MRSVLPNAENCYMTREASAKILCRAARVWSAASIGLLCAFLFGEGPPPLRVKAMLFPFGVMLGLILAWRFERVGGLLTAGCVLLFYTLNYLDCGRFPKGYAFMLISAPSVIFLCSGFLRVTKTKNITAEPEPPEARETSGKSAFNNQAS